jgi:RNA polymerase sigma-70 factor (ECF subfamily)
MLIDYFLDGIRHITGSKHVDAEVISRAIKGDSSAIETIYLTYGQYIFNYILKRTGEVEVAQDLTQEVFKRMIEGLSRYEDRGWPISAWLFKIANGCVMDYIRRKRRISKLVEVNLVSSGFEEEVLKWLERQEIKNLFHVLTPEQRIVIEMRFYMDLSPSEVAQALGKSTISVRALQHRAIEALKRQLNNSDPGDPL